MASTSTSSRRQFLRASAGLATTAGLIGPAFHVLGANDTIRVGCIGTGGRCRALMRSLARIENVKITAVCDVYEIHLAEGRQLADDNAFACKHYPELLRRPDVDAVLIGSPDHWHVKMTVDSLEAGKPVYVEKPLTHSLEEGKTVLEAQKKHKKVVQVGTQQRSMPHILKAHELVKAGKLGKIHKVRLSWNRNTDRIRKNALNIDPKKVDWKAFLGSAREQPFDEYRFRNWRWFWDFGGGIFTDLMVHWIDVAHWFLDLEYPEKAVSVGQHVLSKGVWETPDEVQTLLVYPGVQAHFEGTFSNARNGAMIEFQGTDGSLYIDRGRYEFHPERGKGKAEELILGTGPRGRDFYDKPDGELLHLKNWIDCVRTGKTPSAPVEAGVTAAAAAHLANQALRSGQTAIWKG